MRVDPLEPRGGISCRLKMTSDKKTQASGAVEKAAGKVQNTVGGVKDAANR
jgi:hypothetical protein